MNKITLFTIIGLLAILCSVVTFAAGAPLNLDTGITSYDVDAPEVTLTWEHNDTLNLDTYNIFRQKNAGIFVNVDNVSATTLSYPDAVIELGNSYTYRIFAINTTGSGFGSSTVTESVPSNFYGDFEIFDPIAQDSGEINVSWEITGYGIGDLNANVIENITITRWNGSDLVQFEIINESVDIDQSYYIDSNESGNELVEGQTYDYNITVYYNNGEEYSDSASVAVNYDPRIISSNIIFDRVAETVTWDINLTDLSTYLEITQVNASYEGITVPDVGLSCTNIGGGEHECSVTFLESDFDGDFLKDQTIFFEAIISEKIGGFPNSFNTYVFDTDDIPNAAPNVTAKPTLELDESGSEGPELLCNYTFFDEDGDSEGATVFKWYVKNEGFNDFVEILEEVTNILVHPKFDSDDIIICSVLTHDGIEPAPVYVNSSEKLYSQNQIPLLYFLNTSTTASTPVTVGDQFNITAKVRDEDLAFSESLNISFCPDSVNQQTTYGDQEEFIIGSHQNASSELWFFSDIQGIPIEEIQITANLVFNATNSSVEFSSPIYDFYVYEVDAYGAYPSPGAIPVATDEDNVVVADIMNRYTLEPKPITSDKYFSIKMCINNDDTTDGSCDPDPLGSFTFMGNTSYENVTEPKRASIANESTNASSDNVRLYYGFDIISDGCGESTLCSVLGDQGDNDVTLSCAATASDSFDSMQLFSAIANDGNRTSQTRTEYFYINHKPIAQDVSIAVLNGTNVSDVLLANGSVKTNENLFCNFTIYDQDTDANWLAIGDNYTLDWQFKPASLGAIFTSYDNGNDLILPYGITQPGDTWTCTVTPLDAFSQGTDIISTETIITYEDASSPDNRPEIISISDNSDSPGEAIYVGEEINVSVTWQDPDDTEFKFYICGGDETETTTFRPTGCLADEYLRVNDSITVTGASKTTTLAFDVPSTSVKDIEYNYTVFVCDEDFDCSVVGSTASSNNFYAFALRSGINISVVNQSNGATFTGNLATTTDNLVCNFEFLDPNTAAYYNQSDYDTLQTSKTLNISWWRNTSLSAYEKVFENQAELANTQTGLLDRWYCQVEFIDAPQNQQTNASSIIVTDGTTSASDPILTSFLTGTTPANEVNVGDTAYLQISWTDADVGDEVYAYICNSSDIVATGCLDTTIGFIPSTTATSPIVIEYTPTNNDPAEYTVYAQVFDASFQNTTILNQTLYINHKPTADNVTITRQSAYGDDDIFKCNYDYVSNDATNDENTGNADFEWYTINNGSETLSATNSNYVYDATGFEGFIYCKVQVEDVQNNEDSSFVRSNNTESIAGNKYTITLATIADIVNTTSYTAYGILQTNNTGLTAYVYKDNSPFIFNTSSNISFAFENPRIDSRATIKTSASIGDTLIALDRDGLDETLITFNNENRSVGFEHNRSDFTYYNYTYINSTPTSVLINLTEGLEYAITAGEYAENFLYKNMTGRFEIVLPLHPNVPNNLELASVDGGYLLYAPTIFPDIVPPTITTTSSNANQSNLQEGGNITILIRDDVTIDLTQTVINISNGSHWYAINYSGTTPVLSGDLNSNGNFVSNFINVSTALEHSITIYFDNLITANYTFNVSTKDIANNSATNETSFMFNTTKNVISTLTLSDGLTGHLTALEGNLANVTRTVSGSEIFASMSVYIYKNETGNTLLYDSYNTPNETSSFTFEPIIDTCYYVTIQAVSQFGIYSALTTSQCIFVDSPSITVTDIQLFDGFTGNNTELLTTMLNVSFTADASLLDTYIIDIFNRKNSIDTFVTTYDFPSSDSSQTILNTDFVDDSCYYANVTALTVANQTSIASSNCLYFNTSATTYIFTSTQSNGTDFFINDTADFSVFVYRADNVSYELFDITGSSVIVNETNSTDLYGETVPYSFSATTLGVNKANAHRLTINVSGDTFEQLNQTIVFDDISPELGSVSSFGPYNNTDTITITMSAKDETLLRTIYFVSNKNGSYVAEEMTYASPYGDVLNYTLILDNSVLSSGYNITYYFNATDYAGNSNISVSQNITIENRPPEANGTFPTIYWNATAPDTLDVTPYIIDPDNNPLNYTLTGTENLTINDTTGIISGHLIGISTAVTLQLNASDSFNTTSRNFSITATTSCPATHVATNIYVGFEDDCTAGTDIIPLVTGGNGGSGGGSGRGSSGAGSAKPYSAPITEGYYQQNIFNIVPGQKKFVTPPLSGNMVVKNIEFQYAEEIGRGSFEITELQNKPAGTGAIGGDVHKYFQIAHTGLVNEKIINGILLLRIPKNNDAGITQDNAYVGRWNDGRWEEYKANFDGDDVTYNYYELDVPGFSYWAVYRKVKTVTQDPISTPMEEPREPSEPDIERPAPVTPTVPEKKGLAAWLWLLFVVIVVGGIGGAFVLTKQRSGGVAIMETIPDQTKPIVKEVDSLGEYIKKQLDKGIVREEILAKLLEAGWNRTEIEKTFNKIIKYERRHITMNLVDSKIITQIENMLLEKKTEKEIVESLQLQHIPMKTIQSNMHYYTELQELDVQVTNWIAQGYSLTDVKKHLLDLKWPIATVYEVIKRYKS